MKRILLLLIFFSTLCRISTYAQQFTVPVNYPVYDYLYLKMLEGEIPEYRFFKIPLSVNNIIELLDTLQHRQIRKGKRVDSEISQYYSNLSPNKADILSLTENLDQTESYIFSSDNSALYSYADSNISLFADLVGDFNYISESEPGSGAAFLMSYGLKAGLDFNNSLAFSLTGLNGNVYGERTTALYDNRIRNSFTFNKTGLNNFDFTNGYIAYSGRYGSLFAGREKFLAGASQVNRSVSGDLRPEFDRIEYELSYKSASVLFFHGWLVNQLTTVLLDTSVVEKIKPSKYISYARFSIHANDDLRFGLSQIIIYAYRQPELAYLFPFLFWESAQRSMNDPDNGYLGIDFYFRPISGIGITGEVLVDDLNFEAYSAHGFNSTQNQTMIRLSAGFSEFMSLRNSILFLEYSVIRPYTFSHPGLGDALNFTNNGVPLGDQLVPNSINYAIKFNWFPNARLQAEVKINYLRHGKNVTDIFGNVTENVGGDIHKSYNYFTPKSQNILSGEREQTLSTSLMLKYRLSYRLLFEAYGTLISSRIKGITNRTVFTGISLNYAPFGEKF